LRINLLNPFEIIRQKDSIKDLVIIRSSASCIALSEVLDKIKDSFKSFDLAAKELLIVSTSANGMDRKIYIDTDLTEQQLQGIRGRSIVIKADWLEVVPVQSKKEFKIDLRKSWLHGATITFIGKLFGKDLIKDNCLYLSQGEKNDTTRRFGYHWN
jgi:hypothetical protein